MIAGIAGFFYSASFGSPGEVDDVAGLFGVNGWHNLLHIATGAIGLLVAGFAARRYAFWLGIAYLGIALWGFVLGGGARRSSASSRSTPRTTSSTSCSACSASGRPRDPEAGREEAPAPAPGEVEAGQEAPRREAAERRR